MNTTDDKLAVLMEAVVITAGRAEDYTTDLQWRAAVRAAAVDYGRAVAIAELEAAAEGGGCCLCGAVDPDWVCLAHQRLAELRAEEA